MALTPKQQRFCEEYLLGFNATQAYLSAGYRVATKTAGANGHKLLKKPEIQAEIKRLQAQNADHTAVTPDRVLQELAGIAFTTLRDVAEWQGDRMTLKDSAKLTQAQAAAIQSVSVTPTKLGNSVSIRLQSKDPAIEKLGKFLGMFGEMNGAIAVLKTYGIELGRVDGRWQVLEDNSQ